MVMNPLLVSGKPNLNRGELFLNSYSPGILQTSVSCLGGLPT